MPWTAIAGLAGGVLKGILGQSSADKQMRFQERTLKHQYQWAMQDMQKAGLNPILAYQQGGAGSAPGASFSGFSNIGHDAASAAELGSRSEMQETQAKLAQERQEADLAQLASSTALNLEAAKTQPAIAAREMANAALASAQQRLAKQDLYKRWHETENTITAGRILEQDLHSARAAGEAAKLDEEFFKSKGGQILRHVDRIGRALNPMETLTRPRGN